MSSLTGLMDLHVPKFVKQMCAGLALASVTLGFSGCQGVAGSGSAVSQVRYIDASIDAGGIDVFMSNTAVAYNLGFGTITSYIPVAPGTYNISANYAGSKTVLTTARASLATSKQYTVVMGNTAANLSATVLSDQSQPAPSGQIALRFLNQSTRVGAVDIYAVPTGRKLTDVSPIYTNLTFGVNTGYLNIPTNTYAIYVVTNGTVPATDTVALYTGGQTSFPAGSARTFVLIDQQVVNTPAVNVIVANDYDSATATQ